MTVIRKLDKARAKWMKDNLACAKKHMPRASTGQLSAWLCCAFYDGYQSGRSSALRQKRQGQ